MTDFFLTLRSLVRAPVFTAVTILVLALGVGANTAIFSVVDAALLKPMPIPVPDRIVRISGSHPQSFVWFNPRGFEVLPSFMRTASLDAIGAYVTGELSMAGHRGGRLRAAAVTPEVFDVLKVAPQIGKTFTNEDVSSGSFHLAVISHELWQTHFDGATDVLGLPIVLNRQTFAILGVMPRGFEMPLAAEVWVPSRWDGLVVNGRWIFPTVIARMRAV